MHMPANKRMIYSIFLLISSEKSRKFCPSIVIKPGTVNPVVDRSARSEAERAASAFLFPFTSRIYYLRWALPKINDWKGRFSALCRMSIQVIPSVLMTTQLDELLRPQDSGCPDTQGRSLTPKHTSLKRGFADGLSKKQNGHCFDSAEDSYNGSLPDLGDETRTMDAIVWTELRARPINHRAR
jgi:hypothetical protein